MKFYPLTITKKQNIKSSDFVNFHSKAEVNKDIADIDKILYIILRLCFRDSHGNDEATCRMTQRKIVVIENLSFARIPCRRTASPQRAAGQVARGQRPSGRTTSLVRPTRVAVSPQARPLSLPYKAETLKFFLFISNK